MVVVSEDLAERSFRIHIARRVVGRISTADIRPRRCGFTDESDAQSRVLIQFGVEYIIISFQDHLYFNNIYNQHRLQKSSNLS